MEVLLRRHGGDEVLLRRHGGDEVLLRRHGGDGGATAEARR